MLYSANCICIQIFGYIFGLYLAQFGHILHIWCVQWSLFSGCGGSNYMPSDTTTTNLHRSDGGALKGGLSRPLALLTKTWWLIVSVVSVHPLSSRLTMKLCAGGWLLASIALAAASFLSPDWLRSRPRSWLDDSAGVSEAENVCCLELSVCCGKLFADQDSWFW